MDINVYEPNNYEDSRLPRERKRDEKRYTSIRNKKLDIYKPTSIEDNPFPYQKTANYVRY
jgi:hypothetical protein